MTDIIDINRTDPRLVPRTAYINALLDDTPDVVAGYVKVVNRIDRLLRLRTIGAPDSLVAREKTLLLDAVHEVVQYDDIEPLERDSNGELPPILG